MKKIVINSCYGGFGLSALALKSLAEKDGKECYFFTYNHEKEKYISIPFYKANDTGFFSAFTVPNPQDYRLSERDPDGTYHSANARAGSISPYIVTGRDDERLVAVVEQIGVHASDSSSKLVVVEIPDDVDWEIEEDRGCEWVSEKHRKWD